MWLVCSCGASVPTTILKNMQIPRDYLTGNPGMDEKISEALRKEPTPKWLRKARNQLIGEKGKGRITVAAKEDRTWIDGTEFASKGEMERFEELFRLQQSGQIKNLEIQVPFILQEEFISRQYGDILPIIYVADFVYIDIKYRKGYAGRKCVEDYKGKYKMAQTDVYKIKRKMFLHQYGLLAFFES